MKALEMLEVIEDVLKTYGNLDVVLIADDCDDPGKIKVETVEVLAARVDGREVLAFVSVGDVTTTSSQKLEAAH